MEERLLLVFRVTALLACAVACLQTTALAAAIDAPGFWLACLASFGLAFWCNTADAALRPPAGPLRWLLIQLPACLAVPDLVYALALEAPLVLSGRPLVAWLSLQAAVTVAVLGFHAPDIRGEVPEYAHLSAPVAIGLHIAYCLAWQAVIVPLGVLAAHALRARRELLRLAAELGASQELLAEGARAAERARLAHAIDDALGHALTEVVLHLELAARHATPPAQAALRAGQDLVRRLLGEVRELRGVLRPAARGVHVDLGAALRTLVAAISGPRLHLALPELLEVSPLAAHVAFRCVQEAVTNCLRHADARNIWIELRLEPTELRLQIRDDGRGALAWQQGSGLAGMRDRVEEAGGALALEPFARPGFALSVQLPLTDRVSA